MTLPDSETHRRHRHRGEDGAEFNADDVPLVDTSAYDDVEAAIQALLDAMGGSTSLGAVDLSLTNKSGSGVIAGDVVVISTANDSAFTTTTTARSEVSLGVAQATIASNAAGVVRVAGLAALVKVPASVTRGHYVETHTTAKNGTGSSTRRSGSFGQFLTGGTTPAAWLWGGPDQTASGGGGGAFESAGANWWRLVTGVDTISDHTQEAYHYMSAGYHELVSGDAATGQGWIKLAPNNYDPGGPATAKVVIEGGHGLVLPLLTADPSSGNSQEGQVYFNTTTHKFRGRANSVWVDLN